MLQYSQLQAHRHIYSNVEFTVSLTNTIYLMQSAIYGRFFPVPCNLQMCPLLDLNKSYYMHIILSSFGRTTRQAVPNAATKCLKFKSFNAEILMMIGACNILISPRWVIFSCLYLHKGHVLVICWIVKRGDENQTKIEQCYLTAYSKKLVKQLQSPLY